jgi:EAL domain-containing protein (putative c-di-GMP-specific phosphodiesterase class I)
MMVTREEYLTRAREAARVETVVPSDSFFAIAAMEAADERLDRLIRQAQLQELGLWDRVKALVAS